MLWTIGGIIALVLLYKIMSAVLLLQKQYYTISAICRDLQAGLSKLAAQIQPWQSNEAAAAEKKPSGAPQVKKSHLSRYKALPSLLLLRKGRRVVVLDLAQGASAPELPEISPELPTPVTPASLVCPALEQTEHVAEAGFVFELAPENIVEQAATGEHRVKVKRRAGGSEKGIGAALWQWFSANPLLFVGLVVLLTGVAFALNYIAMRGWFSLEMRLVLSGVAGAAVGAAGWKLRLRDELFGMGLLGAGFIIDYLTLFTAGTLEVLGQPVALSLTWLLVLALVLLALKAEAEVLAVISYAGGYLAPLLLSAVDNGLVMLGFYALLSAGACLLLWRKTWDIPLLISVLAVFGIGSWWGLYRYEESQFLATELYLVAFFLIFNAGQILLASRADTEPGLQRFTHATLLFALPLVAFSCQYGLVFSYEKADALSALMLAFWYLLISLPMRNKNAGLALAAEASAITGLLFLVLAVPLAFSAVWTSCTWALQGLGGLWLGKRLRRPYLNAMGCIMQVAALVAWTWSVGSSGLHPMAADILSRAAGAVTMAGCGFVLMFFPRQSFNLLLGRHGHSIVQVWSMTTWGLALNSVYALVSWHYPYPWLYSTGFLALALSCLFWLRLSINKGWRMLWWPIWGLLPLLVIRGWEALLVFGKMLVTPLRSASFESYFFSFANGGMIVRPLVWLVALYSLHMLAKNANRQKQTFIEIWLNGLMMLGVVVLSVEVLQGLRSQWYVCAWMWPLLAMFMAAAMVLLLSLCRRGVWLFVGQGRSLALWSGGLLAIWFAFSFFGSFFISISAWPLPWIPLCSPMDCMGLICLVAFAWWVLHVLPREDFLRVLPWLGLSAVVLLTVMAARNTVYYQQLDYTASSVLQSPELQFIVSALWGTAALVAMYLGSRRFHQRGLWLGGLCLLGITVVKLLLFDLGNRGTVSRVASFIILGLLILGMAWYCPLPPAHKKDSRYSQ